MIHIDDTQNNQGNHRWTHEVYHGPDVMSLPKNRLSGTKFSWGFFSYNVQSAKIQIHHQKYSIYFQFDKSLLVNALSFEL